MKLDVLISVIVPAYNSELWIARCLDSICAQTYSQLEIIVIDDGSTDRTGEIIDEYARKDQRLVPVHQENAGLVAVREKGIQLANGQYIGFVDSDDEIIPDMYERLLKNALKYRADISHCGVVFAYEDGRKEPHYGTNVILEQNSIEGQCELLKGNRFEPSLCNKLYAAGIMCDSCPDMTILNNEDLLRNFVLFQQAKKSVFEDFCGYIYYQRSGSMSKNTSRAVAIAKDVLRARKLILDRCDEAVRPSALRCWLSAVVNTVNRLYDTQDSAAKLLCRECRGILKQEKKNIRYLIRRQQIAAYLILCAPWLHRIVYKIYSGRR